jgi:RNA polymerase sigma factor (sigma-70 family)
MPTIPTSEVIQHLRSILLLPGGADLTDGQLLECFVSRREPAALEALVRRHAPMVWGVCRRVLRNHHDAEDAFQAAFLVLVRKAAAIRCPAQLGNWLYGVAHQTALKARATRAKRKERERPLADMPEPILTDQDLWHDVKPLLDQEVSRLPEKYRTVVVLCDLEGKTGREAARHLGLPQGTVASRLARARMLLAKRLARHGLAVSGGALAGVLAQQGASASVPALAMTTTIKAVTRVAAGEAASSLISAKVAGLVEGVTKAMLLKKLKTMTAVMLVVVGAVVLGGGLYWQPGGTANVSAQSREVQQKVETNLELQRLQGVWVPQLLLTTKGAEAYPLAGRALYFHGSEFVRIEGRHTVASGSFRVEDGYLRLQVKDHTPWDLEAADIRESTQYAFRVEGDQLTLCYSIGNKGKAGDLTPGKGRLVVVYRRQAKAADAILGRSLKR